MQKDGMISGFLCVFIIAPFLSDGRTASKVAPDMTKFLNTSDPIWSYMTTSQKREYDCKVDVIDDILNEDVLFRRYLAYRKVIISEWEQFLDGDLYYQRVRYQTMTKAYNAMNVSYREHGTPLDSETLVYQSADNMCGVFAVEDAVNDGQQITYELRVKNSSIESANRTDCFQMYLKIARKQAKVTYLPDCQDILIGINNIIPGGSPDYGAVGLIYFMNTESPVHTPITIFGNQLRMARVFVPSWMI